MLARAAEGFLAAQRLKTPTLQPIRLTGADVTLRISKSFTCLAILPAIPSRETQDDPLQHLDQSLKSAASNQLHCTFEERTRWEEKDGGNFGKKAAQQDMPGRLRRGFGVESFDWPPRRSAQWKTL